MDDAIAIALEDGTDRILVLVALPTLRARGEHGARRERLGLNLLGTLTGGRHPSMLAPGCDAQSRPESSGRSSAIRRTSIAMASSSLTSRNSITAATTFPLESRAG
jgi:hypothetical protein